MPAVIAGIVLTTFIWFKVTYPYGVSHCCSKGIGLGLSQYAMDHYGWLPNGKSSPEASLSKLCPQYEPSLAALRGKNIPLPVAQAAWDKDGQLGPESCGWHYIEGLWNGDDPGIAVAWDKVFGLGHNGQRIRGFAHEVIFLDGSVRGIAMKEWPKFASEQREKLAKLIASRPKNDPPIRWSDEETLGTNRFPAPK